MSGTGYMPGSARYHIGDKVDYVIEAEQAKRDYIANTRIVNLRSTTCVSGTKLELRNQNLKTLIEENEKKIIKCIKRDDKLLMIVCVLVLIVRLLICISSDTVITFL